jgi:predicted PurR-regulated permease PerM
MHEVARTNFERVLDNASRMSLVLVGVVVALVAIQAAQVILAPVLLAIVIGLKFGPLADLMDKLGEPE